MFRAFGVVSVSFLVLCYGCIGKPSFTMADDATSPSTGGAVDDNMVLIPATTILVSDVVVAPASNGNGNGNSGNSGNGNGNSGDGKGGGKGPGGPDAGGPPPPVQPPAAPVASTAPLMVGAFWLDEREVSAGEYALCVASGVCSAPQSNISPLCNTTGEFPSNCLTHDQARAYCTWQKKRLPQDDEWTAAARGSASRKYPWGDEVPSADRLNGCGTECSAAINMYPASDGFVGSAPRGSFAAGKTPEGVFDLAGNVAEWVDGTTNVVRGGSYADSNVTAVATDGSRTALDTTPDPTIGFRCARSP